MMNMYTLGLILMWVCVCVGGCIFPYQFDKNESEISLFGIENTPTTNHNYYKRIAIISSCLLFFHHRLR